MNTSASKELDDLSLDILQKLWDAEDWATPMRAYLKHVVTVLAMTTELGAQPKLELKAGIAHASVVAHILAMFIDLERGAKNGMFERRKLNHRPPNSILIEVYEGRLLANINFCMGLSDVKEASGEQKYRNIAAKMRANGTEIDWKRVRSIWQNRQTGSGYEKRQWQEYPSADFLDVVDFEGLQNALVEEALAALYDGKLSGELK